VRQKLAGAVEDIMGRKKHPVLTLLKLEFVNKFGTVSLKDGKSVFKSLFYIIGVGALMVALYYVSIIFFNMFERAGILYEALVLVYGVVFAFLCITGVSSTSKVLYYKGDNEILMRFPIKPIHMFVSKTLFLILTQLGLVMVVLVPLLVGYAAVTEVGISYYVRIPISILFCVLIPFFIANVFAIPGTHLANKIKNKHGLIIILFTIVVSLFFAIYMLLFDSMVQFLKDTEFSVFSPEVVKIIKDVCKYLIPIKYLADMMVLNELYIAYPVLINLTALTLIGTILVIVKLYQKTLLGNIEAEGSAFKKVTKNKVRPVFLSLMNKEFLEIFRSVNYSFQYFVLACAMPLMVFFCNRITLALAKNQVGEQITLGITLLVMLIFTTIICSFSATSISREGNNVYHIKIIPVSPLTQLAAKFTMYFIVSFVANVVCIAVIIFTKQLEVKQAFGAFGVVQACSIALTLFSMRRDIVKPYFNLSGEGELVANNVNTTMSVGIGLLIALVIGVGAMFIGYLVAVETALYYSLGVAGGLLILSFLTYFTRLKHRFDYIGT